MKAIATIHPRLIPMIGRKQYQNHPLPTVVRELLQNSRDACLRRGVAPDIHITVRNHPDYSEKYQVICADNGIGMTEAQLVNDFLSLGGDSKSEKDNVGGFGVAKAAIMSCNPWSVQSLDNYIDEDIVAVGAEVEKREAIIGTIVTVTVNEHAWYSNWKQLFETIYLSDVHVNFHLDEKDGLSYADEDAGFHKIEMGKEMKVDDAADCTTKLCEAFQLPRYGEMIGHNIIRINGLFQFAWTSGGRETNLFFDFIPIVRPEDSTYPVTMNREQLCGTANSMVRAIVAAHDTNVLQSKILLEKKKDDGKETVLIVPGCKLTGKNSRLRQPEERQQMFMGNATGGGGIDVQHDSENKSVVHSSSSKEPTLAIVRYTGNPATAKRHATLLRVWRYVLEIVASDLEEFGIGITDDQWVYAQRMELENVPFYILNAEAVSKDQQGSNFGFVLRMWMLAAHEVTHYAVSAHDERFTTIMDNIVKSTSDAIYANLKDIARLL